LDDERFQIQKNLSIFYRAAKQVFRQSGRSGLLDAGRRRVLLKNIEL
jgi:hypothetical protein